MGSIAWIELPGGGDCSATGRFYADALGWNVNDDGETAWFDDGAGLSGAFVGDLPAASDGGPILYLGVDEIEAVLARITASGGTIVMPRTEIAPGVGHRATFRDPAGNLLGLWERPRAA
jgi:predicted enzyme related to lactoylglutathione lyase